MGYVASSSLTVTAYANAYGVHPGDVVYTSLFGQPVVVLSSIDSTRDLLDKRGANYSSRPQSLLYEEL